MVDSGTPTPPTAPPPTASAAARRGQLRWYVLGAVLLLLAGAVGGSWAIDRLRTWRTSTPATAVAPSSPANGDTLAIDPAARPLTVAGSGPVAAPPAPADLAGRVRLLEAQIAEIKAANGSLAGNASRAESLLIAFAARRALDRGLALGTLESQLQLRFGDDQPNAVRTVIDVARSPVTLDWLQTEFDKLAPALAGGAPDESLWGGFRREMGSLFVLRDAAEPSTRADQRVLRARRLLDAGLVDAAIREIGALPGAALAETWVAEARRYHEARRALDLIETAAILEPQESASPTSQRR